MPGVANSLRHRWYVVVKMRPGVNACCSGNRAMKSSRYLRQGINDFYQGNLVVFDRERPGGLSPQFRLNSTASFAASLGSSIDWSICLASVMTSSATMPCRALPRLPNKQGLCIHACNRLVVGRCSLVAGTHHPPSFCLWGCGLVINHSFTPQHAPRLLRPSHAPAWPVAPNVGMRAVLGSKSGLL